MRASFELILKALGEDLAGLLGRLCRPLLKSGADAQSVAVQ